MTSSTLLMYFAPERRRLRRVGQLATSGVFVDAPSIHQEEGPIAKSVTNLIPRSPGEMRALKKRFVRAGWDTPARIAIYTAAQIVLPIGVGLLLLLGLPRLLPALTENHAHWLLAGLGTMFGTLIPATVLRKKIEARQKIIRNGLADALDLLIVCLEAGSALDQAIIKVSDEMALVYPPLAQELRFLMSETRAGKPRIEAFRGFADRTGVDDVKALVAMLVQTDRFGTSVAKSLRTHADTSRTKRRQRAEEQAAKMGVKLVFPLVLLLFPAYFIVLLGPAIVTVYNQMQNSQ
jgi:tight adherence protein C